MQDKPVTLSDDERQRCEIWTRCMGYHRPVDYFNAGKKSEFYQRRYFTEKQALKGNENESAS